MPEKELPRTVSRSRVQHLRSHRLRPADRAERGAGTGADPHPCRDHPYLSGGRAYRAVGPAVRPHSRGGGGLRRRSHRCLFSPFGYNPIFCVPPILYGLLAGAVRRYVTDRPAPAPHGAGLLPRGHRGLRPVAEHGAGSGVRRRCQAGIFSGKAGVPQHPVRPHRHGGHADRVAAAASRRTQRCAAAYPGQGRRRA